MMYTAINVVSVAPGKCLRGIFYAPQLSRSSTRLIKSCTTVTKSAMMAV
nr:MAG TPA: hypothetical protein [Caudoviricetes sp.]